MAANESDELKHWAETWRTPEAEPSASDVARIVARVRRRTRVRLLTLVFECLLAAAALALVARFASADAHAADRPFAAVLAVAVLVFVAHGFWNLRGTWRAVSTSVRAFIELERRRGERRRVALRAGWVLLAVLVVAYTPWIFMRLSGAARGRALVWLAALALFEAVVLAWLEIRNRKELAQWSELGHDWQDR